MSDNVTLVPVKSPVTSKTNITGALLSLFAVLSFFEVLPEGFNAPAAVDAIVFVGGLLVILFRTISKAVLRT